MNRNILKLPLAVLTLIILAAGCGKPVASMDENKVVSIPVTSVSSADDKNEETTEVIVNEPEDAETKEGNEEIVQISSKDAKDKLVGFVENREKCLWDGGDENGEYKEYEINEFILAYRDYMAGEKDSMYADSAIYGFVDCGVDGIEELVLAVDYGFTSGEDYGVGMPTEYFLFRVEGDDIVLFDVEEAYFRISVQIDTHGIMVRGGSSGAATYDNSYYAYLANGEKQFICSSTDTFINYEPFISYYDINEDVRPENYPAYSGDGGYLFPEDTKDIIYHVKRLNFTNYDALENAGENQHSLYVSKNIFFVGDSDDADVEIPSNYLNYYDKMGIKLYNFSEYYNFMAERLEEIGLDSSNAEGEPISWMSFSLG